LSITPVIRIVARFVPATTSTSSPRLWISSRAAAAEHHLVRAVVAPGEDLWAARSLAHIDTDKSDAVPSIIGVSAGAWPIRRRRRRTDRASKRHGVSLLILLGVRVPDDDVEVPALLAGLRKVVEARGET
jgi:hypothetical protein